MTTEEQDAQRSDASAPQELPDWEDARGRVFVALRPLGFFHSLGAQEIVARASLPMLAECVVLDLGDAMTYVGAALVSRWGVEIDELYAVARANVETKLTHDLAAVGDDDPPKIYALSSTDSYDASRLLSLAWLAKAREALGAEGLVCAAPDRDTLLLAVDFSPPTLVRMAELAEKQFAESDRSISPALYVFTPQNELGPLELLDEHPLRERVRRGHLMLADVEYGVQKIALDAGLEGREPKLFVASYFAVEREGAVFSYATWAEGVDALLPVVDLLAFTFTDERAPILVPFEAVAKLAGALLEPVKDLEPMRLHTIAFPNEDLIDELRDYAVEL